jgi:hypothetical protein
MSNDWGQHYIIPSSALKSYSGGVVLREQFDEDLLNKELETQGIMRPVLNINNPWYYRKKGATTWIKIGESNNSHENFPTRWGTTGIEN